MADIAIFRINYKSDFILTLNSDAGWMTPFCIKFWTGAPSQAYFVGFDGTTYTHCAPVDGEPTKLRVQFDDHHLPIGDMKFQIGYHFTVADFPTSVEDEVINQASVIIEVDDAPAQVMLDLNGETAPEIEFSLPAYANEAQRIANEEQRIAHEAIRIVNEESRIAAETIRQQNEAQRISNEESRVTEFARLKQESETATADANAAATLANEKAALAADKAALADDAATLANAKAQLAADKAALADDAATLANDKAALAQQKAAYAQEQGDYAKAQGDYAKAQSETAQADHERAESDHTRAESDHDTAGSDHTQAGTDHTRAESDHTTAASDHTQAGTDHTRAESDHATASADHTQAGQDHTRAESDHAQTTSDHTQAGTDHTRAESDHATASADHTRAESDHTRAESDHASVEVYVDSLGAFDISAYHATGGVLAKYADLTAALGTNGANVPDALRKGGMSVKYVQSIDNEYVQYRLMTDSFNTTPTNWQGVDDEPTAGSNNLVTSGGVFSKTKRNESANHIIDFTWDGNGYFNSDGTITEVNSCKYAKIDISKYTGKTIEVRSWTYGGARNLFVDSNNSIISTFKTVYNTQILYVEPVVIDVPLNAAELWLCTQYIGISGKLLLEEVYIALKVIDNMPTAGSNNPVKSSGVKSALDLKQDKLTFDDVPIENSNNPVTSDGLFQMFKLHGTFDVNENNSYKKEDLLQYNGFIYKFFNDITELSLDKMIGKGKYYHYNGKNYKCIKTTQNYSGQNLTSGDIVFKDNTLKKYNGSTFADISFSDLSDYLSEATIKEVIIDNTLPYYPNRKINLNIPIQVSQGVRINNVMYYTCNLPINTKVKTRFTYSGVSWQLTALKQNNTILSCFGGRIKTNKEYEGYIEDEVRSLGIYLDTGEAAATETAILELEIDLCPFTSNHAIPVIFDSDWGGDIDDSVAVSCLGWGQKTGQIQILGSAISRYRESSLGNAVVGLDAELQYYGIKEIPITTVPVSVYGQGYAGSGYNDVCIAFPHTLQGVSNESPTQMYRRILANLPKDSKIDIIVVGTSYNIKELLNSSADTRPYVISDLVSSKDGEELMNTKVKNIFYMAGSYPEQEESYNVNTTINYTVGQAHKLISDTPIKAGTTIYFKASKDGIYPYFKIYYKDSNGNNHEIPENIYLTPNIQYTYTFTEEAKSIWMYYNNNNTGGSSGSFDVNVSTNANRKAEANMSFNGGSSSQALTATTSSLELITKFAGTIYFLGFTTNCVCGDNLYGTNRTWDILYQTLDAYTSGNEEKWTGDISQWTSGHIHAWDPLTVLLAIQGYENCGFGLSMKGINILDAVQYRDNVLNPNFGYNDFMTCSNGNHFYVFREYLTTSLKYNRYNQLLNSIICNENWITDRKKKFKILDRIS